MKSSEASGSSTVLLAQLMGSDQLCPSWIGSLFSHEHVRDFLRGYTLKYKAVWGLQFKAFINIVYKIQFIELREKIAQKLHSKVVVWSA